MNHASKRTHGYWRLLPLAASLALFALACAVAGVGQDGDVAPQQWNETRGPVVPHDSFPLDCSLCHEGENWQKIKKEFVFDHAKETGVALEGAHARAECLRCHNDRGPVALFADKGCAGCHEDVHAGKLGSECTSCHDENGWSPRGVVADHSRTRFPLVGAHAAVTCTRCHPGADVGNFDRASTACVDCHAADLARATNPDHQAQGWVSGCERCHAPTGWTGGGFNHSAFPLTGRHATADCAQCHPGSVYDTAPTQCAGCHLAEYQASAQPPHASAGFSTDCQMCHTSAGWTPASFDHSAFPLTGAHLQAQCSACHSGGVYSGLPTTCVSCHQGEYNATTQPNHVAANYPTSCEQCHTTVAWTRATFSHAGVTRNCAQCHTLDYNQTTAPNHAAAGLPTTCQTCHTTTHWTPSTFNHSGFPLTGAHASASCNQCHGGGVYDGLPTSCVSCHQSDYNTTNMPNHTAAGYPTSCEQCHSSVAWTPAGFNHAGVTRNCAQCHQVDYNQTTDPNHSTNGYPTTCQQCHSVTAWTPANFSHGGVTRNCVQCHLVDYNQTSDPNHTTAGFPTTCQTCHDTVDWDHGTFNHTWFPINSGAHHNLTCAQCHPVPRNSGVFTCTDCHEHRQSSMDSHHQDVNNYVYNSNNCYACHPNGHAD